MTHQKTDSLSPLIAEPKDGPVQVHEEGRRALERLAVDLPSGKRASVLRRGKGRHLKLAARMTRGSTDQMDFIFALIAVKTLIGGQPITVEDVEELDQEDVTTLIPLCVGNGSSVPGISSS